VTLYYQTDTLNGTTGGKSCSRNINISVIPGSHFKFCPLEKNADIFGRVLWANFLRNGPGTQFHHQAEE